MSVVRMLLVEYCVPVNQTGSIRLDGSVVSGFTPLMQAADKLHVPVVELLLEHGVDVNAVNEARYSCAAISLSRPLHSWSVRSHSIIFVRSLEKRLPM